MLAALLSSVAVTAQAEPRAVFVHDGAAELPWRGLVPVSIPWPQGLHQTMAAVRFDGQVVPCDVLLRWPRDGSVAVVRAWPRVEVEAGERVELSVAAATSEDRVEVEAEGLGLFGGDLPFCTVLEDPFGETSTALFHVDPSAPLPDGHLVRHPAVRVRRFVGVHRIDGRGFLGVRAYLRAYPTERRAELTLVLDNGAGAAAPVSGPVRFRSLALRCSDPALRWRLRDHRLQGAPEEPAGASTDGAESLTLLGPSDQLYLGDRTAKAFRFDLLRDPDGKAVPRPPSVRGYPELSWVRATAAFGAHGGPGPATPMDRAEARGRWLEWLARPHFGAFGDFGDFGATDSQGTPRNGPFALGLLVRTGSPRSAHRAEAQVLQHGLRPSPGAAPRLPPEWRAWRQGLSPRTIDLPHGFAPLDYEHFSVDLLFDWYWLTGDAFARDELARAARGLPSLLRGLPFETARGEGWCLQAAVAMARCGIDDGELLDFVHRRFVDDVLPKIAASGTTSLSFLPQPAHKDAFGVDGDPFDAPWQIAAFVHGAVALWRATGDPEVLDVIERATVAMTEAGWVEGVGPKYLMSSLDPGRYRMPVGHAPLDGTAKMQIGAFVLADEVLPEAFDRARLRHCLDTLLDARRGPVGGVDRWLELARDRGH